MGGARWRIETEFETEQSGVGLDEYETRAWAGWHHHITMCLLAGAFLLTLQQDWGKTMPQITRPQVYRVVRELLPKSGSGRENCWGGWQTFRNVPSGPAAPTRNAAPLSIAMLPAYLHNPSL